MSGVPDLPHEDDFDLADDIFELPEYYDTTVHYGDDAFELTGTPLCGVDMREGFASDDVDEVDCPDCALLLMLDGRLPG